MKKYLAFGLYLLSVFLLQTGCSGGNKKLTIKTFIDGSDTLKIQGSKIWFEHEEFSLPGKHGGHDEPTTLNGYAWRPEWNENTSVPFEGLKPVFHPESSASVKLTKIHARGEVTITERPTAENGQTLAIHINDPEGGPDWYEVMVEWK